MSVECNTESIIIKELKENDVRELFNLLNELDEKTKSFFHPHPFDIKSINDICKSKKDHYFVMFLKNRLIGYSFLRLFGYDVPSFGIIIRKGYIGRGYGTFLTKWMMNKAKDIGYNKIILKTYKDNLPAKRIYDKVGFKIVGLTENKKQYKMELLL